MSNFKCEHCGENIIDSPRGYITGCSHYPLSGPNKKKSAWATTYYKELAKGYDHGWAAHASDEYCKRYSKK